MSGSPVYIDGKLVGAVAFSFPFSKEPIAGITPIEEMLAIERAPAVPGPGAAVPLPLEKSLTLDDLLALYKKARGPNPAAGAVPESFLPLNVPVLLGGFSTPAFERASAFFSGLGFQPVRAGSAGQSGERAVLSGLRLQEGDAVGVQLMGGDLDMTAVGTVTYVDGDKVLAFGHPFYNLGAVDFADDQGRCPHRRPEPPELLQARRDRADGRPDLPGPDGRRLRRAGQGPPPHPRPA